MTCGTQISETLIPIFFTDFGVKRWCQYLPFVAADSPPFASDDVLSSPGLTFCIHSLIFLASFIIGYSWKPIIASKSFDFFKDQVVL